MIPPSTPDYWRLGAYCSRAGADYRELQVGIETLAIEPVQWIDGQPLYHRHDLHRAAEWARKTALREARDAREEATRDA